MVGNWLFGFSWPNENFMSFYSSFRNGSLVRDAMKRAEAQNSWETFSALLDSTPRGNYGNMALHFNTMEIIPQAKGVLRWNKTHSAASPDAVKGVLK